MVGERKTNVAIDHIAIAVPNLDRAIRWYCVGAGLELLERRHTQGRTTSMTSALLGGNGVPIILVEGHGPENQIGRFIREFGPGVQHLALSVADIDEAVSRLSSVGGSQDTSVINGNGIRQIFLRRDLESGVRVELIERKGGDFNDQSVTELFRQFEEKNLY